MFGDDSFDNSAIDLDRVRKLAGLPNSGEISAPAPTFEPEASYDMESEDLGLDDMDDDAPAGMGSPTIAPLEVTPPALPFDGGAAAPAPVAADSHWSQVLSELEAQMDSIPVGDFRDIIDSLRRLANYAEDIRRSLVTEGRKSLRDYVIENLEEDGPITSVGSSMAPSAAPATPAAPGMQNKGPTTLGANRNDAVKALGARMGGRPQDMTKAQKVFSALQAQGKIKQKGSNFEMDTMDDASFTSMVDDPMLKA